MMWWTGGQESFGSCAVNLFFLLSGMLITASWLRSRSMQDFLMKRVLRIYPGYIVAVGLTGLAIWLLCPEFRAAMGRRIWLEMLLKDWLTLSSNSTNWHGIFAQNPYPDVGNGSLWTIQKEFLCYLLAAGIGLFCLFKQRILILVAALVMMVLYAKPIMGGLDAYSVDYRFPAYFLIGMCVWLWRDKIPFTGWLALAFGLVLGAAAWATPWFAVLFPLAGGYVVLWIGFQNRPAALDWTERTDLSYGAYLYAFPVQQIVAMNPSWRNPWLNFLVAAPATLLLAWLSWNFVEKRFLALKRRPMKDCDVALLRMEKQPAA